MAAGSAQLLSRTQRKVASELAWAHLHGATAASLLLLLQRAAAGLHCACPALRRSEHAEMTANFGLAALA